MGDPELTRRPRATPPVGGVLLAALYLWVTVWLLLAVVLPAVGLGWEPVVITSGSMQPLIREGDVVLVADGAAAPGDVVTYSDPSGDGTLTTHRVVAVAGDGTLRTQGDANTTPDSTPIAPDGVVGRGRLLVPMVGLPLHWLTDARMVFAAWLAVTALAVVVVNNALTAPPSATRRPSLSRRLHDVVYRGWRPNPSRARRATPSTVVIVLAALLARSAASAAAGAACLLLVLLFDPDGPQLRIGHWEQLVRKLLRPFAALVPRPLAAHARVATAAFAVVVAVGVLAPAVNRSVAAFQATDANAGNSFTASTTFP